MAEQLGLVLLQLHAHLLLLLLLLLHSVDVVQDHLLRVLRRVDLLLVHGLLRRVLSLLQVHFGVLVDPLGARFRIFGRLVHRKVRLACRLSLSDPSDGYRGLRRGARQLRLRSAIDAETLAVERGLGHCLVTVQMVQIIELLLMNCSSGGARQIICILARYLLSHRLGGDARVALVIARGHRSRLVRHHFALLDRAGLFLRRLRADRLVRDDALLMQRVVDRLRGADAVRIGVSALLLLVHVLAQARLFLGRKLLLCVQLGRADDGLGATLRIVLLA